MKDGRDVEILHCDPECGDACTKMVMKRKPAVLREVAQREARGLESQVCVTRLG